MQTLRGLGPAQQLNAEDVERQDGYQADRKINPNKQDVF